MYFHSPSEFDAGRYVLEHAPSITSCDDIERMFAKLKRQQQVLIADDVIHSAILKK